MQPQLGPKVPLGRKGHVPCPEKAWRSLARQQLTLTAILRMDALTEVHLSCLRSMTRMNPMPASCRLKREGTVSMHPEVWPWLQRVSGKSSG